MVRIPTRFLPVIAAASAVGLTAYSSGPSRGGDLTGSPFQGNNQCSSCHNGGSLEPETNVELLDATGATLDAYTPGETYTLRVTISNADAAGGYGFQAVVLDSAGTTDVGAYGAAGDGTQTTELGPRTYFEHARPLDEPLAEIEWTAPEAGTGEVVVYAAGNAVNRNGSTGGDNVDLVQARFAESAGTSSLAVIPADSWSAVRLTDRTLRIDLPVDAQGDTSVELVGASGRRLASRNDVRGSVDFDVADISGLVVVRLVTADGRTAARKLVLAR